MRDNKANRILNPFEAHFEWAMDCMNYSVSGSRKIRTLNIIDYNIERFNRPYQENRLDANVLNTLQEIQGADL